MMVMKTTPTRRREEDMAAEGMCSCVANLQSVESSAHAARASLCEQEVRPGVEEPRNPDDRLKDNAKDASIRVASC